MGWKFREFRHVSPTSASSILKRLFNSSTELVLKREDRSRLGLSRVLKLEDYVGIFIQSDWMTSAAWLLDAWEVQIWVLPINIFSLLPRGRERNHLTSQRNCFVYSSHICALHSRDLLKLKQTFWLPQQEEVRKTFVPFLLATRRRKFIYVSNKFLFDTIFQLVSFLLVWHVEVYDSRGN